MNWEQLKFRVEFHINLKTVVWVWRKKIGLTRSSIEVGIVISIILSLRLLNIDPLCLQYWPQTTFCSHLQKPRLGPRTLIHPNTSEADEDDHDGLWWWWWFNNDDEQYLCKTFKICLSSIFPLCRPQFFIIMFTIPIPNFPCTLHYITEQKYCTLWKLARPPSMIYTHTLAKRGLVANSFPDDKAW